MFEEVLVDYGTMGIFIIYLIYDKQVIQKKIVTALENLTVAIQRCVK